MVRKIVGGAGELVLQAMGILYGSLPRGLQIQAGNALGSLLRFSRFRSKVIRENLGYAFGNSSLDQQAYNHLGNLILEILMLFGFGGRVLKRFVLKYVDLTGKEHVQAAQARGKGLIFLSSHLGNWEVMAAAGGLIAQADLLLVTKHLKPQWLHDAIERGRLQSKVRGTYEPKTMRDVLKHLKQNGAVGIVLDQYTGPPVGVRVPLFNQVVGTSLALAILAKRTGTTVLPVENYRTPDGRWRVDIKAPLQWQDQASLIQSAGGGEGGGAPNFNAELAQNTAHYVKTIEAHILAHPEQWLWTHRRFKGDLSPLREGEWSEGRARN